jgi:hypothetical protein
LAGSLVAGMGRNRTLAEARSWDWVRE